MLIEELSTAYRCQSAIGNSIDLKEMIHEVLKVFVSESYAIYGEFCLTNDEGITEKFDSFGKMGNFDSHKYIEFDNSKSSFKDADMEVFKISLDNGFLFFVSKKLNVDSTFFISMFESLIPKLNISVNACLNYNKLKNSNDLLLEQKKELINANKTKDDFLANMSHELKTPLNSITVISTIMAKNKNDKLQEQEVKNMKIIKKCSEDLSELINDILDISKIEAGELKIHKENISLKFLINDIYDLFEPVAANKGLKFINKFEIENYEIFSDESRIKQIIKNLISNALKFTNKGKVEIISKEFDKYLEISVVDTGIGMDKENLLNVFDRFKQVDNSRTKKYKGTGLGLAISKELASLLNSNLEVTSELYVGTTFKYIIPKKSYENLLEKREEEKKDTLDNSSSIINLNLFKKNIYLFHSNNVEQFKLTIALKKHGLKVTPLLSEIKLDELMDKLDDDNYIFILDSRLLNFQEIINKYKFTKENLIVLSDEIDLLDDELYVKFNLENKDMNEKLIKYFRDSMSLEEEHK